MTVAAPLTIRRRSERDCETVVSWVANAAELYLFSGPRLHWPLRATQLSEICQIAGFSAWVLVDETARTVVGHFDLTINNGTARLGRVIVAPQRRGQGLAHVLVDHAIELARAFHARQLSLNVIADNEPAIHTYQRAGFRPAAGQDRPDVCMMTLRLDVVDASE